MPEVQSGQRQNCCSGGVQGDERALGVLMPLVSQMGHCADLARSRDARCASP
jgi:hypothetical protein